MKVSDFGRKAYGPFPYARASGARAESLAIPACRNAVLPGSTFANHWRDALHLLLDLLLSNFSAVADVGLQPCAVAAVQIHEKLGRIKRNQCNLQKPPE